MYKDFTLRKKCKHQEVRISEMISHTLFQGSKYTSKLEPTEHHYIRYECMDCGDNGYNKRTHIKKLPKWVRKRIDILIRDGKWSMS